MAKDTHTLTRDDLSEIRIALADVRDRLDTRTHENRRRHLTWEAAASEARRLAVAELRDRFYGTEKVVITYPQEDRTAEFVTWINPDELRRMADLLEDGVEVPLIVSIRPSEGEGSHTLKIFADTETQEG